MLDTPIMSQDEVAMVPVKLDLSVLPMEEGIPGTKTTLDPDNLNPSEPDYSDCQIANFVVLQYEGTSIDAVRRGAPASFDHWPLHGYDTSDPYYDETDVLYLVATESVSTVVILANTFGAEINYGSTLGELLACPATDISGLDDLLIPDNGDNYFRMSGMVILQDGVTAGTPVVAQLKRNVAKVTVEVSNSTAGNSGDDVVSLKKVQLKDINGQYYYFANVAPSLEPGVSMQNYELYYPGVTKRFDLDAQNFPDANNSTGEPVTFTYYVPINLRGTTSSAYQYNKGTDAPAGATYLRVYGSYGDDNTPITYTYYLGGNLVNDFNIKPNCKYTYQIDITQKGDAHYDARIEDMAAKTFDVDANCYMLQPPQTEGTSRIYSFPVRRAAVFWNERGVNSGLYGARIFDGSNTYEDFEFTSTTAWTASILWSDFDMSSYLSGPNAFLQAASGTGFDPANPVHSQPYIKVKVQNGMSGNVVVGLKLGDNVVWSWHLWITDYDPDCAMEPQAHRYIYPVTGGEILRFNTDTWNTTAQTWAAYGVHLGMKYGFAMDRYIGELGAAKESHSGSNGMKYQYGRKDPFLDRTVTNQSGKVYVNGTSLETFLTAERSIEYTSTGEPDYKNSRYAVTHPMVRLNAAGGFRAWTSLSDELSVDGAHSNYVWNDHYWDQHTGDQAICEQYKSFFDPCPPGWKNSAAWGIHTAKNASTEQDESYTTVWDGTYRIYYPETYANRERTGGIYYRSGTHWYTAATSYYNDCSYGMEIYSSIVINYTPRANLCYVRCMRE